MGKKTVYELGLMAAASIAGQLLNLALKSSINFLDSTKCYGNT